MNVLRTAHGSTRASNDVEKLKQGELTTAIEERTKENKQLQGEDCLQEVLNGKPPPKLKQIHVLVVVPKQATSSPPVSSSGVFDICTDAFFSQLTTVDRVGEWLNFSSLLPLTKLKRLSIRRSYELIAEQALLNVKVDMGKYALVTGYAWDWQVCVSVLCHVAIDSEQEASAVRIRLGIFLL
ncbi:hypothetical protein PsorP6_006517 [Peronosclerospora sorghi]|uniref:Uncharacterized protein n=1 Tax=Peronosclerospora sorghi TaxID=230839 RepID=A0ACC0W330_9STRA|nr:hypothetical protein PsorP6_006517 [Peronosclerospora sorghi]